jgi:5-formyltetrahydrofolate cyclo-ligase
MQATEEDKTTGRYGAFRFPCIADRMTDDSLPLSDAKRALRARMRTLRTSHAREIPNISKKIADLVEAEVKHLPVRVIAGYAAFRDEIDLGPALAHLRACGYLTALPVVIGPGSSLSFRLVDDNSILAPDRLGIPQPPPDAATVEPDLLLVPLLAFDRQKRRLGYGGGFYDRTLMALRARKPVIAIGIAAGFQEVAAVPAGPQDAVLDLIATENAVF